MYRQLVGIHVKGFYLLLYLLALRSLTRSSINCYCSCVHVILTFW